MSWTLLDSGSAASDATSAVVSGKVGTGAELIVAVVSMYHATENPVAGDLTDTLNTYSVVTQQAGADASNRVGIYYKVAPSVSASMTFTFIHSTNAFPALIVYIFNESGGSTTFGTSVGNGTISGGTIAAGSIGNTNDLIVEGNAYYVAGTNTIDGSFSTPITVDYNAATNIGVVAAWKEVTGAVNPTWTLGGSVTVSATRAVSFTGSGGGGPVLHPFITTVGGRRVA